MSLLFLLLALVTAKEEKTFNVPYTEIPPRIDGVIEEVWQRADPVEDFVQHIPYERSEPTERTIVYVLQDDSNIYFAFRCYAQNHKPIANPTKDEDYVIVKIDPFGSQTSAYYFWVFASEIIWDGWIHDDGRTVDDSWEGVWYRAVKVYDDRFDVEIKIPFKSIRYKKGLEIWGVQFVRHIAHNLEDDYWTEVLQVEGDLVSKWGTMSGINPHSTGYHFELYPEGYVRNDRDYIVNTVEFKPSLSLNAKWDLTSQTTLNATLYPDFAHIESDPFALNLDRYPVFLDERRPFFLEGMDIFRMSDFGPGKKWFEPLRIFYSRQIGKSIGSDVVPIITGLKLTNKSTSWNSGVLGVHTAEYNDSNPTEPGRWFGVLRGKYHVFGNSDVGVLFSGMAVNKDDYNYALGIDGVYRSGVNQIIVQGAVSHRNSKRGWALSTGYTGFIGSFSTVGAFEVIQDSFDVSSIGFVPWVGRQRVTFHTGPHLTFPKGLLRDIYFAAGTKAIKEAGHDEWSKLGVLLVIPNLRPNWGFALQLLGGPYYEADTNYMRKELSVQSWASLAGHPLNVYLNYAYVHNYARNFLAYRAYGSLLYNYSVLPTVNPGIITNVWVEWDTLNTLVAVTPRVRPNILFQLTADVKLEVFSELVIEITKDDVGKTDILSNRFGILFAWRFLPKSWLYVALNDYREQNEQGNLQPQYRIGAIKAKYLVYF